MRPMVLMMAGAMVGLGAAAWGQGEVQARQQIDLSGQWEYVRVAELEEPPAEGWEPFEVPGMLRGVDYQRAWFRRQFEVPQAMAGQRIVLHFGGVKFNSTVRVNGETVGGHFGGHEAFEVDITDAARVGETNLLELGCHDWTGVFIDRETDFSVMQERPVRSRSLPTDKILAPIGGHNELFGPWDDVSLRSHPQVWVSEVFVRPSVRDQRLRVDFTLVNATDAGVDLALQAEVEDGDEVALSLPEQQMVLGAGETVETTVEAPWTQARYWSHEDPYLYHLRARLVSDDQTLDESRTRFGFREFWIEGPHYYLNGARVNLRATSWWPSQRPLSKAEIEEQMRGIRDCNCVIFRTHTQPWRQVWYDTADEMGVMMVPEGAIWNDDTVYRIYDERFWDNYAEHLRAMAERTRNNPSVVMYSLENEMYGPRMNEESPARHDLARMGELLRQWDPTRPIYYESDGDPLGVADAIGIHYPHEYPRYTRWPNTAYWLDTPKTLSHMFDGEDWVWTREKPLYIGEYLWIPSSDPSWHTVFFGDEAYLDYEGYGQRARALSWRMATQAYRYYEVGAMSPWTVNSTGVLQGAENPLFAAQQWAMEPLGAYLREYDHNFYSGEQIARTADVYNDVLEESDLTVRWSLESGDVRHDSGERELAAMQPGERRATEFTPAMPQVAERTEATLSVVVEREGREVFRDEKPCSIFPPLSLRTPAGATVGVYDPAASTAEKLAAAGFEFERVTDLVDADCDVLVIGAGAWEPEGGAVPVIGGAGEEAALTQFVRAGGRVLVLEQAHYPPGAVPASLTDHTSTMTFPQMPDHPVLAGIRPPDLKWWRTDHVVTAPEPVRPLRGASRAIVVSGSQAGIDHAPLLELPQGEGTMLLSQMRLAERLGVEPAAGVLVQNAIDYLAGFEPNMRRTALFCPDPATRRYLRGIGLDPADVTDDPAAADWDGIDLLIACSPLQGLAGVRGEIDQLLGRGGTLLLHGVTPQELRAMLPEAGLELTPYQGPATRVPDAHPLSACFANEDLYWLGEARAAHSWATKPLSDEMTDFVFAKTLEGREVTEYSYERMEVEGAVAERREDSVHLSSGGASASAAVQVAEDGEYIIGVVAGGTQAEDTWPAGAILVDGERFGQFTCQQGDFDTYTTFGRLTAGEHVVTVRFTNDLYRPPDEDRNLHLRSILLARDEAQRGVTFLTSPPAVAVFDAGPGRVVVDNINWAEAERNTRKAARYICGLLTGLGARFSAGAGTVIEAESLEHDPEMSWYRAERGYAYLGDVGYIEGTVRCETAGRYILRIIASGTPAEGEFPIIALSLDGRELGQVQLQAEGWLAYPMEVTLTEGEHTLRLSFTNDLHAPPEDRNLMIDRIEVLEAED
ncbi:MAG: carbohydrate-binding domain-containing protein [Armatimonadota bacterium]